MGDGEANAFSCRNGQSQGPFRRRRATPTVDPSSARPSPLRSPGHSGGTHPRRSSEQAATRRPRPPEVDPCSAGAAPVRSRRHPARQDGCLGVQGVHLRDALPEAVLGRVRGPPRRRGRGPVVEGPLSRGGREAGRDARLLQRHVLRAPQGPLGANPRRIARQHRGRLEQGPRRAGRGQHGPRRRAGPHRLQPGRRQVQDPRQAPAPTHRPLQQGALP